MGNPHRFVTMITELYDNCDGAYVKLVTIKTWQPSWKRHGSVTWPSSQVYLLQLDGRFQQQTVLCFISGFLLVMTVDCKLVEAFPPGQAVVSGIALAAVPEV